MYIYNIYRAGSRDGGRGGCGVRCVYARTSGVAGQPQVRGQARRRYCSSLVRQLLCGCVFVDVCVYVVYVSVYVCMYVHTHIHTLSHTHTVYRKSLGGKNELEASPLSAPACKVCVCVCVCVYRYNYISILFTERERVCVCVCIDIYIYICIYMYTYTYIIYKHFCTCVNI